MRIRSYGKASNPQKNYGDNVLLPDVPFRHRWRDVHARYEVMVMVNVGALDMLLRFLLAMGLFSLATLLNGDFRWLGLLGLLPLMSAVFRYCPVYGVLHLRSCSEQEERRTAALRHPAVH